MSYFNRDQEAHMEYLAGLPWDKLCWCGWETLGHCFGRCSEEHPGKSREDRRLAEQAGKEE